MKIRQKSRSSAETKQSRTGALSLFSGAGGLDLGLFLAGGESLACVEFDPDCNKTLASNKAFAKTILFERDIRAVSGSELLSSVGYRRGEVGLVIGGPPCQPFSKAAYWTSTGEEARRRESLPSRSPRTTRLKKYRRRKFDPARDPRSEMIDEYLRVLRATSPSGFVFENVLSIRHPSSRPIFEKFLAEVQLLGYSVTVSELNAAEFGVAQLRKRVFIAGLRGKVAPESPKPTHTLKSGRTSKLKPAVVASDVLAPYSDKKYFEKEELIVGRYADCLKQVPPGWNYKALSAWAGHPHPIFEAESRFWHFLLKLHPDKPSWTIAANPGPWTGPFHWETRRLRIPEFAALQSFPAAYKFVGSRRSMQRQIGNAVPPLLARSVIKTVLDPIVGKRTRRGDA
jgi:DNA (cytosine-5)-methyltransferase 1